MQKISADERRKRIKELQVVNNRKNLIRELRPYAPNATVESFLDIDETVEMVKKVYEKIDTIPNQKALPKDPNIAKEELLNLKESIRHLLDKRVVLFHGDNRDTGALIIELGDFFNNLCWYLNFVRFISGYGDVVLVEENLKFGVCVERYEYQNNMITWGF